MRGYLGARLSNLGLLCYDATYSNVVVKLQTVILTLIVRYRDDWIYGDLMSSNSLIYVITEMLSSLAQLYDYQIAYV